jgi:hypothetical protein
MKIKQLFIYVLLSTFLVLGGCRTFEVGGWIDSVNSEGKNTKATFGGGFSCTIGPTLDNPQINGTVVEGQFQYHDHNYMIPWRNKERSLSFHGDFIQPFSIEGESQIILCALQDLEFVVTLGTPDGYCGPARLQPSPKTSNDFGYGVEFAYRIAINDDVTDGGSDAIQVWFGPAGFGSCPVNQDNIAPDDGSDLPCIGEHDLCYENSGMLGGGQVTVPLL